MRVKTKEEAQKRQKREQEKNRDGGLNNKCSYTLTLDMPTYMLTLEGEEFEVSIESDNKDELVGKLPELLELYRLVATQAGELVKPSKPARRRRGKSEAIEVLRHLEEKVLKTNFFKQPRSTAEVRAKLKELVGVLFQSRKVSQALGILHERGLLSRVGQRGAYKYYSR
jgi:hypothetical protein